MNGRSAGNETISVRFVELGMHPIDQGVSAASCDGTSGRSQSPPLRAGYETRWRWACTPANILILRNPGLKAGVATRRDEKN
jgi:hypothetical protein